jgi:dephospho-CoA kinase
MTKLIGITGGIGSGKSTVAQYIQGKGFPIYNSDYWAKELVNIDQNLKLKITQLLGENAYHNQKYNRKWVADKVFKNHDLLQQLNQIIHPAVAKHFHNWVSQQNSSFIFKETALLFELGLHKNCYKTILVTADEEIRIHRVMQRDHKTHEEVTEILLKQMPENKKREFADFVIYNNDTVADCLQKTDEVLEKLIQLDNNIL